jgi:formylglycine-generating enzyme required for sulfatase activity
VPELNLEADGYRLPTKTEWEYAARGGLKGKLLPWGNMITHSQANYFSKTGYGFDVSPTRGFHPSYNDHLFPYTSPVASFAANGYGLFDMAGNVTEWCWDSAGSYRSIRGGGWDDELHELRCRADRFMLPADAAVNLGFRVVCR